MNVSFKRGDAVLVKVEVRADGFVKGEKSTELREALVNRVVRSIGGDVLGYEVCGYLLASNPSAKRHKVIAAEDIHGRKT